MTVRRLGLSLRARMRLAAVLGVAVASVLIGVGAAGLRSDVLPFKGWGTNDSPPVAQEPPLRLPAPLAPDVPTAGGSPVRPGQAPGAPLRAPLGPVAGIAPTAPVAPPAGGGGVAGGGQPSASGGDVAVPQGDTASAPATGTLVGRAADADHDGLPDVTELRLGTDPHAADSDADG